MATYGSGVNRSRTPYASGSLCVRDVLRGLCPMTGRTRATRSHGLSYPRTRWNSSHQPICQDRKSSIHSTTSDAAGISVYPRRAELKLVTARSRMMKMTAIPWRNAVVQ
jgi:hypothetical protein